MRLSSIMFFLTALVIHFYAQAKPVIIDGFIISKSNKTALPNVQILNLETKQSTKSGSTGYFSISAEMGSKLTFSLEGYKIDTVSINKTTHLKIELLSDNGLTNESEYMLTARLAPIEASAPEEAPKEIEVKCLPNNQNYGYNTYDFSPINEYGFRQVLQDPLSTFSVDVDRASYSLVRRFINNAKQPPIDAVRIEELINYFPYEYQEPNSSNDIRLHTELMNCPWNDKNLLLKIGLKGRKIQTSTSKLNNIVFLIDISGSMKKDDKLALAIKSYKLLLNKLRETDIVSIVVYGGVSWVALPPTYCSERNTIFSTLDNLVSGGGTPGEPGIELAYSLLERNMGRGCNNRVVIATDGDFNMGLTSDAELQRMMEKLREKSIGITVLGFGIDNLKDNKLEIIADKGNGNYDYIDCEVEAKKFLVEEFRSTMLTIAKDVKLQLEFNPRFVLEYRQIGYENRAMENQDFDNVRADAGEIGSDHTVTALYEIVLGNCSSPKSLKYQTAIIPFKPSPRDELLTINVKYKQVKTNFERDLEEVVYANPLQFESTSTDFKFMCAVAEYGMLLRDSKYKGNASWDTALNLATNSIGEDEDGYRGEFIGLIRKAMKLY